MGPWSSSSYSKCNWKQCECHWGCDWICTIIQDGTSRSVRMDDLLCRSYTRQGHTSMDGLVITVCRGYAWKWIAGTMFSGIQLDPCQSTFLFRFHPR